MDRAIEREGVASLSLDELKWVGYIKELKAFQDNLINTFIDIRLASHVG